MSRRQTRENAWRFDRGEELGLHGVPWVCERCLGKERGLVHLQVNPGRRR